MIDGGVTKIFSQQDLGAGAASGCASTAGSVPSAPPCTTMLTIPAPPSVNKLYRNVSGRGRCRTREYKNWLVEVAWSIREQLAQPGCDRVPGRVNVIMAVERTSMLADCDNLLKAALDALVKQRAIDDDRFVTSATVVWAPPSNRHRPVARLLIMPATEPATFHFHPAADGATGGWFLDAPDQEEAA